MCVTTSWGTYSLYIVRKNYRDAYGPKCYLTLVSVGQHNPKPELLPWISVYFTWNVQWNGIQRTDKQNIVSMLREKKQSNVRCYVLVRCQINLQLQFTMTETLAGQFDGWTSNETSQRLFYRYTTSIKLYNRATIKIWYDLERSLQDKIMAFTLSHCLFLYFYIYLYICAYRYISIYIYLYSHTVFSFAIYKQNQWSVEDLFALRSGLTGGVRRVFKWRNDASIHMQHF